MPALQRVATIAPPDPRLEQALRRVLLLGALLVLLLPAARGHSAWLGWGPLWLLAMPASAWWALHRFRLPRRTGVRMSPVRPRRSGPQARRRRPASRARLVRAA